MALSTLEFSHWADALLAQGTSPMYAISFDLDTAVLQDSYGSDSWRNAYYDIRKTLLGFGFEWQQGSVYFGNKSVNAVTCVLATQELTRLYPWFAGSVRDIRMLRIEEQNDLRPAIDQVERAG